MDLSSSSVYRHTGFCAINFILVDPYFWKFDTMILGTEYRLRDFSFAHFQTRGSIDVEHICLSVLNDNVLKKSWGNSLKKMLCTYYLFYIKRAKRGISIFELHPILMWFLTKCSSAWVTLLRDHKFRFEQGLKGANLESLHIWKEWRIFIFI